MNKKTLLIILAVILLGGLLFLVRQNSSTNGVSGRQVEFGSLVTMHINDKVVFSNGPSLILKEINDSRCPVNVQCIWQGELATLFSVNLNGSINELRLGTVNNKKVSLNGYKFSLESATENTAVIMVLVDSGNNN